MKDLYKFPFLMVFLLVSLHCGTQPATNADLTTEAAAETVADIIELSEEDLTLLDEMEQLADTVVDEVEVTSENYKEMLKRLEEELGSEN